MSLTLSKNIKIFMKPSLKKGFKFTSSWIECQETFTIFSNFFIKSAAFLIAKPFLKQPFKYIGLIKNVKFSGFIKLFFLSVFSISLLYPALFFNPAQNLLLSIGLYCRDAALQAERRLSRGREEAEQRPKDGRKMDSVQEFSTGL